MADKKPDIITYEFASWLRQQEEVQSLEWLNIWRNLTFEQKQAYAEIKSKQLREEQEFLVQKNHSDEEIDESFKSWWIRFVNIDRHPSDFTIEDEINALLDKNFYTEEKIKELFDYKSRKRIFIRRNYLNATEVFTFFWSTTSPFSHWHRSSFTASSFLFASSMEEKKKLLGKVTSSEEVMYTSAEQFMMYQKAMLFLDREMAVEILNTKDVKKIKDMGRKVKGYNEEVWKYNRSLVVYEGNKAKFLQNEELKMALLNTKGTTLVEAAPNDTIWGIGLGEDDPRAKKRVTWPGQNLLGEILTQLRIDVMGEY